MELNTKYGIIKIFTDNIEEEAIGQVTRMANSILGENANIRIMPDCHAGAGCVIGTTMLITDKVCPNLVGVDIGCGVDLIKTNINFKGKLEKLDKMIRSSIPSGRSGHDTVKNYQDFSNMRCWSFLSAETKNTALRALGTLGGGNHFIEAYDNGYLSVHSGSRNIGLSVAKYYQALAKKQVSERANALKMEAMKFVPEKERESWLKEHQNNTEIEDNLAYLTGSLMDDYIHDVQIMQEFAIANRKAILDTIVKGFKGKILKHITSTHNYIEIKKDGTHILRKGAIAAYDGQILVIPMNMKDGILICEGKGNVDWNYSAPHGAGRLYSRSKAKEMISLHEFKKTMAGIYSTCINKNTIDEAPMVYKNMEEIINYIEPTVKIIERLVPIYNFKASE